MHTDDVVGEAFKDQRLATAAAAVKSLGNELVFSDKEQGVVVE